MVAASRIHLSLVLLKGVLIADTYEGYALTIRIQHHGFDDPPKLAENAASEDEALKHYSRVRDEIREFIVTLPAIVP